MPAPEHLRSTPYSPLYPDDLATEWIDVFGCAVPVHCGDIGAEYTALRTAAAAMEFSMLFRWDVIGPGAVEAVNSVFSRDLRRLGPDRIAYGVFVADDGTMLDDVTVVTPHDGFVRVIGGNEEADDALLRDAAPAAVSVVQRRDETAQLSFQGPKSREILQSLTAADLSNKALPYYHFIREVQIAGIRGQLNRMGFTAELGYEFITGAEDAVSFGTALLEAGEDAGVRLAGAATVMMARVEAGMVMAHLEYDHTSTPFECRLGWTVDFNKGPFRGRDALVAAKDSARDCVVSVVIDGIAEAEFAPVALNGEPVGVVTMALPSPHLGGRTLGLARIRKSAAAVGTALTGEASGASFRAEVVATPVFDPERTRVRS
ncbi:MAG: aminomethyl transferase family protein [Acidimicrobiaceae bacterium]|nr:aminomethyltransferase family protein [Acidimicrobiaceae bacterium]MDE0515567.1 aminomethyltransferase family protein [Acidimicrobiaceae bacterium]MDE0655990.1 aminomethyltransferase family protein [Acidimicrobiaceae bacterium]MXZ96872.1 aminomethyl transferase family protein [Acidimicrobiaceae bacterium]MYF42975.1 aminomethyl transferase family protein [Acidimicrobiaceae bacterium]